MSRIGREKHLEKQEKMETILANAQQVVSTLSSLMPTPYQKDNLEAMLALFLEAQGHPIPEHSKTKSASALNRFLNINRWSTRRVYSHSS
jgi:hypothetical protein